ncbi:MAG TPA: hypothetical protein VFC08_07985 [Actinomycetota bacterium]|nr:hypothetical protein [Actinomycetota bacterium]
MRRTRPAIALATLLAAVVLGTAPASAQQLQPPCELHRFDGETVQHLSKRQITCAVQRFGPVPGGTTRAICIARRESGLVPTATSEPTGLYRGLYQHDRTMWPDRYEEYTVPWWELSPRALSGRTNAIVTIRMVVDAGTWKAAGWPPTGC